MQNSICVQSPEKPFNPVSSLQFNPLPKVLSRRQDITPAAKIVYAYLASCFGRSGEVCPRVSRIASEVGLCDRQVGRAIAELSGLGLIWSIRTGRANRYFFRPIDGDRHGRHDTSLVSDMTPVSDQPRPRPFIENKSEKETTTAAAVFSFDPEQITLAAKEMRADIRMTKEIRKRIREGIDKYGFDRVVSAIRYCNDRSSSSYGGYLHKAIQEGWGDGLEAVKIPPRPTHFAGATEMVCDSELEARREAAKEMSSARAEAAMRFAAMGGEEKIRVREEFLLQANTFVRRKYGRLGIEDLGNALAFQVWFAGAAQADEPCAAWGSV